MSVIKVYADSFTDAASLAIPVKRVTPADDVSILRHMISRVKIQMYIEPETIK